ncbi:MAG: class I SAM-dependent methyltransferase, partial [Polyangiaceae bacterium]
HVHHGLWEHGDEATTEAVCALVDRVGDAARIGPGTEVCDVGCGYGATARRLTERRGARVVGLTLSAAQVRYAEKVGGSGFGPTILQRDWFDNQLPSDSFDAVIAIESFEHMGNRARFFSEAFRVLRPGGRMVISAWLSDELPSAWERRLLLEPICREGRLAGLPTSSECVDGFESAGFANVTYEELTAKVRRTWAIAVARLVAAVSSRPRYRAFLRSDASAHRIFALTVLRIGAAYAVGAMKYGLFDAIKPEPRTPSSS